MEQHMDLPPGFRFHPTDEELVTHYLSNKVSDDRFVCRAVGDVDLNKCEPWDLPCKFVITLLFLLPTDNRRRTSSLSFFFQGGRRWVRKNGISSASETENTQQDREPTEPPKLVTGKLRVKTRRFTEAGLLSGWRRRLFFTEEELPVVKKPIGWCMNIEWDLPPPSLPPPTITYTNP